MYYLNAEKNWRAYLIAKQQVNTPIDSSNSIIFSSKGEKERKNQEIY